MPLLVLDSAGDSGACGRDDAEAAPARGRARGYAVLSLAYTATAINLPAETFVFHPLGLLVPRTRLLGLGFYTRRLISVLGE